MRNRAVNKTALNVIMPEFSSRKYSVVNKQNDSLIKTTMNLNEILSFFIYYSNNPANKSQDKN